MLRHAMCLSVVATALVLGCGGGGEEKTAVVAVSARSTPELADLPTRPTFELPAIHLQLAVSEIRVHVVPVAARGDVGSRPILDRDESDDGEHGDSNEEKGDKPDGKGDMGHPGDGHEADEDDGEWITISGDRRLDLHAGISTDISLGAAAIPAGRITQMRLVLASEPLLWIGQTQLDVACPSCSTSGLKLVSREDVIVPAGGTVFWKLMFDLATLSHGHDGFKLGPVVHVEASVVP